MEGWMAGYVFEGGIKITGLDNTSFHSSCEN